MKSSTHAIFCLKNIRQKWLKVSNKLNSGNVTKEKRTGNLAEVLRKGLVKLI